MKKILSLLFVMSIGSAAHADATFFRIHTKFDDKKTFNVRFASYLWAIEFESSGIGFCDGLPYLKNPKMTEQDFVFAPYDEKLETFSGNPENLNTARLKAGARRAAASIATDIACDALEPKIKEAVENEMLQDLTKFMTRVAIYNAARNASEAGTGKQYKFYVPFLSWAYESVN